MVKLHFVKHLFDFDVKLLCIKYTFLLGFLLFVNVQGGAFRVGYGVGAVECLQVYLVKTDACAYGYDGAQQFAMRARVEARRRELVPTGLTAKVAYLPDKLGGGLATKP